MFTVTVQLVPGGTEVINLDEPTTVGRCVQLAKVADPSKWTAKVGGETADDDRVISSDTRITLITKQVKGNK